jgi:hypothetical protein
MLINEGTALADLKWLVGSMETHGGEDQLLSREELKQLLKAMDRKAKPTPNDRLYDCGLCGAPLIMSGQKFCHECGGRVVWDG